MATPGLQTERNVDATTTISKEYVSWSAIFAGAVIALIVGSLLNLLGLGLGFTAFSADADTMTTLGISSVVWLILSGIISMLAAGWVAGRLAGIHLSTEGALHGLLTWGIATLLSFLLMATAGGAIINGMVSTIEKTITMIGRGTATVAQGVVQTAPQLKNIAEDIVPDLTPALKQIKQQATQLLKQAQETAAASTPGNAAQSPEEIKGKLEEAITTLFDAANDNDMNSARQKLVDFLQQNANMDREKAEQTVNDWQQTYNDLKEKIMQKTEQAKQAAAATAEQAANAFGAIALVTFFVLLLGAIAAAIGGWLGATRRNPNLSAIS